MSNPFEGKRGHLNGSVTDMLPVTPNDSTDLSSVGIGLYITGAGDVTFHNVDGVSRTIAVPNNFYLICSVKRVLSTSTTATGIHALIA
jgi:hypothetical protein